MPLGRTSFYFFLLDLNRSAPWKSSIFGARFVLRSAPRRFRKCKLGGHELLLELFTNQTPCSLCKRHFVRQTAF